MVDLKEKRRPQKFDEFFGNEDTVNTIIDLIDRREGPPPAFLFSGPRGCGKTTLARILKNELNIHDMDFIEMNSADDRGIDNIRALRKRIAFPPRGDMRIVFLDEAHRITGDAQEALLKMMEVPADHTRFVLATTVPEKLIDTIRSRCKHFQVSLLNPRDMKKYLKGVLEKEDVSDFPDDVLEMIIDRSEGSPREGIDLLDTALSCQDRKQMMKAVEMYQKTVVSTRSLAKSLLEGAKWNIISGILETIEEDVEGIRKGILAYMTKPLLKGNARAAEIMIEFREPMYEGKSVLSLACWMVTKK